MAHWARPSWSISTRWFLAAAATCTAVTLAFLVLMLRTRPGDTFATDVDDVGNLCRAGRVGRVWRRGLASSRAPSLGVGLLSLGALSWAAGEAIWSWLAVIAGVAVPFPSVADAFYLGGVPIAAAGILHAPPRVGLHPQQAAGRLSTGY